jgi:hypothetical protein
MTTEIKEDFFLKECILERLEEEKVEIVYIDEFAVNSSSYSPRSWIKIGQEEYFSASDKMKSL